MSRTVRARLVAAAVLGSLALLTLAPLVVVAIVSFNSVSIIVFPPRGFSLRWYEQAIFDPQWLGAFLTSIKVALLVTALVGVAGVLGAFGIHRARFRGREAVIAFMLSPLVIPGIILGLALLVVFAQLGLTRSVIGLVLGHAVVTLPYVIRIVLGSLTRDVKMLEEAARTLGADETATFRRVTLPLARPAIIGSLALVFILSFDNFTISLYLAGAGNITLPIRIYQHIEFSGTPVVAAVSTLVILLTAVLLLAVDRIFGLEGFVGERRHGFG